MNILYYLLITPIVTYNLPIPFIEQKTKVYIHLERFNTKHNLLHVGISFNNKCRHVRFDFRAFNDNNSYITNNKNRRNIQLMFPHLNIPDEYDDNEFKIYQYNLQNDVNNIYSKNILWGISNKTFDEIMLYEKNLHKKYIIGIYDCRHYVNEFTKWCLDKPTPIWNLHKLWDET